MLGASAVNMDQTPPPHDDVKATKGSQVQLKVSAVPIVFFTICGEIQKKRVCVCVF